MGRGNGGGGEGGQHRGEGGKRGMGGVADEVLRSLRKDVEREKGARASVEGGGAMGEGTECVVECCRMLAGGGKKRGVWDELLMTGVPDELIGALNTMRCGPKP